MNQTRGVRNSNLEKKGNSIILLFILFFLLFDKLEKPRSSSLNQQRAGVIDRCTRLNTYK